MTKRQRTDLGFPFETTLVFPDVPILVTPPPRFGARHGASATLRGIWTTRLISRRAFLVTDFAGRLEIPSLLLEKDGVEDRLTDLTIPIRPATFQAGSEIATAFGRPGTGTVDPETRFTTATLGLSVRVPELLGQPAHRSDLIMRTIGWVDRGGLQIGGGYGTLVGGFLAGTILCCAGFRQRVPPPDEEPAAPPPPPGPLVKESNVTVDREIGTQGDTAQVPAPLQTEYGDAVDAARRQLGVAVELFDEAGVFDLLNEQLAAAGLSLRIRLVIQVQDGLGLLRLHGLTSCGDPTQVIINISGILDFNLLKQILAHELVHAKECAYTRAGQPAPYGGHDTQPFKDRVREFEDRVAERERERSEELEDALKQFMEEQGGD